MFREGAPCAPFKVPQMSHRSVLTQGWEALDQCLMTLVSPSLRPRLRSRRFNVSVCINCICCRFLCPALCTRHSTSITSFNFLDSFTREKPSLFSFLQKRDYSWDGRTNTKTQSVSRTRHCPLRHPPEPPQVIVQESRKRKTFVSASALVTKWR